MSITAYNVRQIQFNFPQLNLDKLKVFVIGSECLQPHLACPWPTNQIKPAETDKSNLT